MELPNDYEFAKGFWIFILTNGSSVIMTNPEVDGLMVVGGTVVLDGMCADGKVIAADMKLIMTMEHVDMARIEYLREVHRINHDVQHVNRLMQREQVLTQGQQMGVIQLGEKPQEQQTEAAVHDLAAKRRENREGIAPKVVERHEKVPEQHGAHEGVPAPE